MIQCFVNSDAPPIKAVKRLCEQTQMETTLSKRQMNILTCIYKLDARHYEGIAINDCEY